MTDYDTKLTPKEFSNAALPEQRKALLEDALFLLEADGYLEFDRIVCFEGVYGVENQTIFSTRYLSEILRKGWFLYPIKCSIIGVLFVSYIRHMARYRWNNKAWDGILLECPYETRKLQTTESTLDITRILSKWFPVAQLAKMETAFSGLTVIEEDLLFKPDPEVREDTPTVETMYKGKPLKARVKAILKACNDPRDNTFKCVKSKNSSKGSPLKK